MNPADSERIFHPFAVEMVPFPAKTERFLAVNAPPGLRPPADFEAPLTLVQGFRPSFLALQKTGHAVAPTIEGDGYDGVLIFAGRHRRENENWLAEALSRTRPGGLIVVSGGKADGIASLLRRVRGQLPVMGHAAKFHGTVFWLQRPAMVDPQIAAAFVAEAGEAEGFVTPLGTFSAGRIDPGSAMLAASLPDGLSGKVADFGAGWGYLAAQAAQRAAGIGRLDLYEANHVALEAARGNLGRLCPGVDCRFFWHDLAAEAIEERYDAILMNPPFHQGRKAEPDIGRAMIVRAAQALGKGGRLIMVANRPLPYEKALAASFRQYTEVAGDRRFKVFVAQR